MNRSPWLVAVLGSVLLFAGCAKRLPSPDLKFEAQQQVVLKFRGGEEVQGHIEPGRRVDLREPSADWTALVGEVTEDRIVLKDLIRVSDARGVSMQVARTEDARRACSESVPDKTFLRTEITGVDFVKLDVAKTAQRMSFWSTSAVVLVLLLGGRS